MTIKRFIEKAINGGWTGLCMDDDTRGGWCSKCGTWKGGAYGINGAGVQSKHVCHQPETKDGSMTLLQSQQEKARAGIKQNFAEQMAPSGVFAVQTNVEDIYPVLDSLISSTVRAVALFPTVLFLYLIATPRSIVSSSPLLSSPRNSKGWVLCFAFCNICMCGKMDL